MNPILLPPNWPLVLCSISCVGALEAALTLDTLNSLGTGNHEVVADGQTFQGYVRNDAGTSWLLVGRGRNGWEFDNDGQGAVGDVGATGSLRAPAGFAPALYSDAIINDLIGSSGIDFTNVEIRIRRAADSAGLQPYQEVRWRSTSLTSWAGTFDAGSGFTVEQSVLSGPGSPLGPSATNTRDTLADNGSTNDLSRVFTWAWSGHGNQKGFSYGSAVTDGANNSTNFWWESGNENHAIPYTEVYIRSFDAAPVPEPATSMALLIGSFALLRRRR